MVKIKLVEFTCLNDANLGKMRAKAGKLNSLLKQIRAKKSSTYFQRQHMLKFVFWDIYVNY